MISSWATTESTLNRGGRVYGLCKCQSAPHLPQLSAPPCSPSSRLGHAPPWLGVRNAANPACKGRFLFSEDGQRIKAYQGHTIPWVQPELEPLPPPQLLYHGTTTAVVLKKIFFLLLPCRFPKTHMLASRLAHSVRYGCPFTHLEIAIRHLVGGSLCYLRRSSEFPHGPHVMYPKHNEKERNLSHLFFVRKATSKFSGYLFPLYPVCFNRGEIRLHNR